MRLVLVVSVAAVAVAAFAACGDDDDQLSASENERLSAVCSTGAAQYSNEHSPPLRDPSKSPSDLPNCAARCGETQLMDPTLGPSWAYSSLPSGSCTSGTHCGIRTSYTQTCDGDTHACNLSGAECECENGQWRCYITSQGAGACFDCETRLDAGIR